MAEYREKPKGKFVKSPIALVGFGKIGRIHLTALEEIPEASVCCIYDTASIDLPSFKGKVVESTSLERLGDCRPRIVIVATPTTSHMSVCIDVLQATDTVDLLIVEKPLVMSLVELRKLRRALAHAKVRAVACLHAAYAPEVMWACQNITSAIQRFGPIINLTSRFADPYHDMDPAARSRIYGTSWLDSGINALSVISRLVQISKIGRIDSSSNDLASNATLEFVSEGISRQGLVTTTWDVAEASKSTTWRFESGATLYLDHQAMSGQLASDDGIVAEYQSADPLPRLVQHYTNMYRSLVAGEHIISDDNMWHLHELLLDARADDQ